jgi:transglutaminase-like putative cysteine protease
MLYTVSHTTTYQYTDAVSLCHNLVHLRPRALPRQVCHQSHVLVQPDPRSLQSQLDYFGNPTAFFTIAEPHKKLSITARHRVEVAAPEPVRLLETPAWEHVRELLRTERAPALLEAYQFVFDSHYIQRNTELSAYAAPSFTPGRPVLDAVMHLTHRIHREFRYDAKATTLATPLREVLQHRHGVCQDFAHLEIGCLRSLGLAARYVSGYLQTRPPPGREKLVGSDASHAWASVFCPSVGWVDFDPTNNMIPAEQHITLAWGRDYDDVSPVKGIILGGGQHAMSIAVDVVPIG